MTPEPNTKGKKLANGKRAWYWSAHVRDYAADCPVSPKALGTDFAAAMEAAKDRNDQLEIWRRGIETDAIVDRGTFRHLIVTYLDHRLYKKLKEKTRRDYARLLDMIASLPQKNGKLLGDLACSKFSEPLADAIYEKLLDNGVRQANYAMAVVKRAWRVAQRAEPKTIPAVSPFATIILEPAEGSTVPASWDELCVFVDEAVRQGEIAVAIAAQMAYDMLMRPSETFAEFAWSHYRPDDRPHELYVGAVKRDNEGWLTIEEGGTPFYPELEALLAMMPRKGVLVCLKQQRQGPRVSDVWKPVGDHGYKAIVRRIRRAAKLPEYVTIAAFRHGGLTELGDAELSDSLAMVLSRHKVRQTLSKYIHRTERQSIAAQRQRFEFRKGRG